MIPFYGIKWKAFISVEGMKSEWIKTGLGGCERKE